MEASSFLPHDGREWRRFRAWDLNQQGWSQRDLAAAWGASEETISRGRARARHGGREALRSHPAPGHPPTLSDAQMRLIPEFLGHGPVAYGFRGQVWTRARSARVLADECGVRDHHGHVGRWLREWGGTPQVPIRRAIPRDEEALRRWREATGPTRPPPAWRERRVLVFGDESGCSWLPGWVRTSAPEGLSPVLREKVTRDHRSVLGGRTPAGTIDTLVRPESLHGWHRVEFLPHWGRVAGERRLVIWDGSPLHRRAAVKEFVSRPRSGVGRESLAGDAPDRNPWDEGGWHHRKNGEMRNQVCLDLEEWHQQFPLAIGRRRQKPHWVRAFFAQAGLMSEKT